MKPIMENSLGSISISNKVIATICDVALKECYGVVGLATTQLKKSFLAYLAGGGQKKGITITTDADGMSIDLYVVVKYGVNMATVSQSVMETVKYRVERLTDYKVKTVAVNIASVKVDEGGEGVSESN